MNYNKIDCLRSELNSLIDRGIPLSDLYDLSVELDQLILEYYIKKDVSANIN